MPRNFFHQISADSWRRRTLSISRKCRIFFSRQMTTNRVKVRKIDEEESQMMKKSIVNLSFKITAQFFPSNQCGQLARLIYLKKMPDLFSHQMTTNKVKVWKIDEDESQIDDGEKIKSWIFHLKLPRNFFHQISADGLHRRALSISRKCRIFFLVKWRQTKS